MGLKAARRALATAGAVWLLVAAVAPATHAGSQDARGGEFFGLSAPELYSLSLDGRFALRDRALAEIERAGIETVRTQIGWRDVEPRPPLLGVHDYEWDAVSRHVLALAEHGQRLMPMLMAPPRWAQAPGAAATCQRRGMVDEDHIDDFAAFAGQVARLYGRDGQFWRYHDFWRPDLAKRPITTYEIWSEPNRDAFSCPAVRPDVYARAVAAAAKAIHAVDPRAKVTVGGLVILERDQLAGERVVGMRTRRFLEEMVAAVPDLAQRIDAVALHTYWATPADNLWAIALAEGWLEEAGLGDEHLIVSEFGWQTGQGPGAVSEATKSQFVGTYADALARIDCRVDAVFPHAWITARADPLDPEDWFGMADPATGEPLASARAYERAVRDNPEAGTGAGCAPLTNDGAEEAEPAPAPGTPAEPAPGPGSAPGPGGDSRQPTPEEPEQPESEGDYQEAPPAPPEDDPSPPPDPPEGPPEPSGPLPEDPGDEQSPAPEEKAPSSEEEPSPEEPPGTRGTSGLRGSTRPLGTRLDGHRSGAVISSWRLPRLDRGRHVVRVRAHSDGAVARAGGPANLYSRA